MTPTRGRWRGGLVIWVSVWIANVLLALVSVRLLRAGVESSILRRIVALLPAVPLAFGQALFPVLVSRMDELRQRLTVGAFALSSAVVGVAVYGWSLLERTGAPSIPTVWIFPAQLLLWSALMLAARIRYP